MISVSNKLAKIRKIRKFNVDFKSYKIIMATGSDFENAESLKEWLMYLGKSKA